MMSKLFFAHPEWKPNGTAIDRKIKVDMETGYQSEDFKEYCHSLGYRIETSLSIEQKTEKFQAGTSKGGARAVVQ